MQCPTSCFTQHKQCKDQRTANSSCYKHVLIPCTHCVTCIQCCTACVAFGWKPHLGLSTELTLFTYLNNLLRSRCMTSSSSHFLPVFPVFSCSFECHILSFHQVTQQEHSLATSCSLPPHSSLNHIMQ